jgi:paraquat-inducible protein B
MSRRVNPSIIGAFVLGAIALLVVAIGLFGSGRFESPKPRFICFFDDSVNGLNIGSPVKFKGVTVGKVTKVLLRAETQREDDNAVPVIVEIDEKLLSARGVNRQLEMFADNEIARQRGLRARLQQQSLITGMLFVEMDFYPGTTARLHKKDPTRGLREIPTLNSNFGELVKLVTATLEQVSQINFSATASKVDRILAQVETGVGVFDFKGINQGVLDVVASANGLLNDKEVRRVPGSLNETLASVRSFTQKLEGHADPLADEARKTATEVRNTLAQINRAAENLRLLAQPETGIRASLDETLRQIADAAYAVRSLANYLERRPNTLILGKPDAPPRVEK